MVAACHSASCFALCFVFWQLLLLVAEYSKCWGEWWAAVEDAMVGWEANWESTNEERQGTAAQTSRPGRSWEVDFDGAGHGDVAQASNQGYSGATPVADVDVLSEALWR